MRLWVLRDLLHNNIRDPLDIPVNTEQKEYLFDNFVLIGGVDVRIQSKLRDTYWTT